MDAARKQLEVGGGCVRHLRLRPWSWWPHLDSEERPVVSSTRLPSTGMEMFPLIASAIIILPQLPQRRHTRFHLWFQSSIFAVEFFAIIWNYSCAFSVGMMMMMMMMMMMEIMMEIMMEMMEFVGCCNWPSPESWVRIGAPRCDRNCRIASGSAGPPM